MNRAEPSRKQTVIHYAELSRYILNIFREFQASLYGQFMPYYIKETFISSLKWHSITHFEKYF